MSNQTTTAITTTPFKIDVMDDCIGMNRFTSHSSTPTTTRISTAWSNGIVVRLSLCVLLTCVASKASCVESCSPRRLTATHARGMLISWMWWLSGTFTRQRFTATLIGAAKQRSQLGFHTQENRSWQTPDIASEQDSSHPRIEFLGWYGTSVRGKLAA